MSVELKEFISPFSTAKSVVMTASSMKSVQLRMLLIWSTGKYWNERLPAGTKLSLAGSWRRMAGGIESLTTAPVETSVLLIGVSVRFSLPTSSTVLMRQCHVPSDGTTSVKLNVVEFTDPTKKPRDGVKLTIVER